MKEDFVYCNTVEEYRKAVEKAQRGQVIIFDEALSLNPEQVKVAAALMKQWQERQEKMRERHDKDIKFI